MNHTNITNNHLLLKPNEIIFIRIFKQEHLLEVWKQPQGCSTYQLFKRYPVYYYSGTLGPKQQEGDKQAPEGLYSVTKNSLNLHSAYHRSFNLGYPNEYDKANQYTGSFLMVHGGCDSIGCYAMTDAIIEEIYLLVATALEYSQANINVHIFPFALTEKNLINCTTDRWYEFWKMLQPFYIYFEERRQIPDYIIENKSYQLISSSFS